MSSAPGSVPWDDLAALFADREYYPALIEEGPPGHDGKQYLRVTFERNIYDMIWDMTEREGDLGAPVRTERHADEPEP